MIDLNSNIDISIIIVNYKSWTLLSNCLKSIKDIVTDEFNFEVIIVDNCSNDNLINEFKRKFNNFKFLVNSANNGFANGCNLGAKNAKGEFLLFLNPDTIISREPILKMFTFLKENSDCGIVSCNQRNLNNSYEKNIRFFPDVNTLFGFFRAINKNKLNLSIKKEDNIIYPNWVSGAVVFISKAWFNKIKGWNEDYWMYYEDIDLSKKTFDLGAKIALITNSEIIHNHGGSSRINFKTSSITKTEVLISKHVYISNHFTGLKHFILQFLVVLNNIITKITLAFVGVFLFFIPKLKLNIYLCINIFIYYFKSLKNKTWLSDRSMNHPIKNDK